VKYKWPDPGRTWPIPELSQAAEVFPADALKWMPSMDEIPDEFKRDYRGNGWRAVTERWFFDGIAAEVEFYPRDGVDPEKAYRALSATLRSYAPSHQHKEAAVAFMMACWFKKVAKWERK
jgi:hypothetical protein